MNDLSVQNLMEDAAHMTDQLLETLVYLKCNSHFRQWQAVCSIPDSWVTLFVCSMHVQLMLLDCDYKFNSLTMYR